MASFPGSCQAVGPAEENGELDGSLQQMLKAIADERTRLNLRQELSGLGELRDGCSSPSRGGALKWSDQSGATDSHADISVIKVTAKSERC